MPAAPRALIFDCDGVIADDEPLHLAAFQRALAPAGITIVRDAYYARYLGLNDREAVHLAFADAGIAASAEQIAAAVGAKANLFLDLVRAGTPLFPGVVPFVRAAAARVPLAVASGALRREIDLILAQAGIAECFATIVSSEDVREGKPSPEGFLLALARLRGSGSELRASDCVVVEDSQPGVEAARRAGMRCVAVTTSHPRAALAGADVIVGSLAEVEWARL